LWYENPMFLDRAERSVHFKVYVASADDSAVRFIEAVARELGFPPGGHGAGQVVMLPVSLTSVPGWQAELHLYTVTVPSPVGARILALKGSDGVLIVVHRAALGAGEQVVAELRWVQIECSGVNSSDTGYFREFSWEA
jgi:hypothetical protein